MAIDCTHPRPDLNLPNRTSGTPNLRFTPPSIIPGLGADTNRVLQAAFRQIQSDLGRLSGRGAVVPMLDSVIYARDGQVIQGVGNGQVVVLPQPPVVDGVRVVLDDVVNPITVVGADGVQTTVSNSGIYDYATGEDGSAVAPAGSELLGGTPTGSVLGRESADTGEVEALTVGGGLELNSGLQVADGGISAAKLADLAVTTAKLAGLAVTTAKLASQAVTTGELGDLAVTSAKLASLSVETAKLDDFAVTTAKLASSAVTNAKMADDSVDTAELVDASVTTPKLADGAVTNAKLALLSVDTGELVDESVTSDKLAGGAVGNPELADMAAGTVKARDPAAGTGSPQDLTYFDFATELTDEMVSNSIVKDETDDDNPVLLRAALVGDVTANLGNNNTTIADDAVTTAKIADEAVTNAKLALLSIDTGEIIDDAVTNAKLDTMAQSTIKGRAAASGTGNPVDLTAAQASAIVVSAGTLPTLTGDNTLSGDQTFSGNTIHSGIEIVTNRATLVSVVVGDRDDVDIGGAGIFLVALPSETTITGFAREEDNQLLRLNNIGTNTLALADNDAGSAAANRIDLQGSGDYLLPPGTGVTLWHDTGGSTTNRWLVVS